MKTVLLLSGGVDSTTLLAWLLERGDSVHCVSFRYGQRHAKELDAATRIASHYAVPHEIHELPAALFHATGVVVPNRNMVFLSLAAAKAVTVGAASVAIAAHAGDRELFPDCRDEFLSHVSESMRRACGVELLFPFVNKAKSGIVWHAKRLNVPLQLTWSCYAGGDVPCGVCGACVERARAFA